MGAISCFSFVGPVGLIYLPKLFTDSMGWTRTVKQPGKKGLSDKQNQQKTMAVDHCQHGNVSTGLTDEQKLELASGALTGMGLTSGFAPLVMITGHGSNTTNNPHASGLDCGACGGQSGEANARLAAAVLNDAKVRVGLKEQGIEIPEDTFFLAGLHDTTTDTVTVLNQKDVPESHAAQLQMLQQQLAQAGQLARQERSRRLNISDNSDVDRAVMARSQDWSQVRPEWGLAGCSAFIVAPRNRTLGKDLQGRAFMHSYNWQQDEKFEILELIMTAPMVVASWISLQYYASTVENKLFGAGNKTLHNVVGKMGILEGNGGDLRVGLPWQSVHDGENHQHAPNRLMVMIEAPLDAIERIIQKHETVRELVTNGWLSLVALDRGTYYRWTREETWVKQDA